MVLISHVERLEGSAKGRIGRAITKVLGGAHLGHGSSRRRRMWREIAHSFDRWSRSAPTVTVSVVFGAAAAIIIVAELYAADLVMGLVINGFRVHSP